MLYGGFGQRDRFLEALEAIEAAQTVEALKRCLDAVLEPYALKTATFAALGRPGSAAPHDTVLSTYSPEWVEHYMRRRYREIDPVLRVAVTSVVPVDWASLDWSPPQTRRFLGEAGEAGIGPRGLALPSRGPAGESALMTVTSEASEREWRTLRFDLMRDLAMIASHMHARFIALASNRPRHAPQRLSAREREALQWAAVGKTIDQTAAILGLSASAVRGYLDSARRKLDCLTKPQAVAVALKAGLIAG